MVWEPIHTKAVDLYGFIEKFNFDGREYMRLLQMFNEAKTNIGHLAEGEAGPHLYERVACQWLKHECQKHGADHFSLNQSSPKQPWYQNFPVKQRNHLYIGRININRRLSNRQTKKTSPRVFFKENVQ